FSPLATRSVRQIVSVEQQVIDNQHARCTDRLLNRFVATERLLIERERPRTIGVCWHCIFRVNFLYVRLHKFFRTELYHRLRCFVVAVNSGARAPAPAWFISFRTFSMSKRRTRA